MAKTSNPRKEQFRFKNPDGQEKEGCSMSQANENLNKRKHSDEGHEQQQNKKLIHEKQDLKNDLESKKDSDNMPVDSSEESSDSDSEDETNYDYDSPEQLRKNLEEMTNTNEFKALIKSLKAKMLKQRPEIFEKNAACA